ncbi:RNA polymerase sigma-70 factor [Jiulongibacter sediminis]|uniref:RNA polymerase sigma-70 factor n=1 Tax=Jiulongibacter sediminis TaxID=1605367 RepID=A0A0P7BNP7_9BACT|nr:RNA polymerase sigma-70 factor [Jiulongibacter sediminis]KPM46909.1 hypothetical protein AFM12_16880 [Jiulongibacter sediminis]TBX22257.1 hypothetical protein TK44_16890 [Jiulongibacter sediminis]
MFAVQKGTLQPLSEKQIHALRAGDASVFEEVFRLHYDSLCRYAFSLLNRQAEAEDLVQQVFVTYWENREKTIISGSLKGYLFRSVHNRCLNSIKHDKVKAAYTDHSLFFETNYHLEVEENFQAEELKGKIDEVIENLPTECQRVFRMSRIDQLRHKEIAEKLSISVKTVENQIGKALKIMRTSLADYLVSIILILLGS